MNLPVRQVAYFCADAREAALAHHRMFGSGPYFVADNIPLAASVHRGVERHFDHTSAYGQWGDVMIEFVHQNNSGPSAMHDMYPEGSGRFGIHHLAVWVDDVDAAAARLAAEGFPTAQRSVMADGFVFAFAEAHAWLLDWLLARPVRDLAIQWKAMGSLVGSFNLLVYGSVAWLGTRLSGDERYARSTTAYALYLVGILNSFTNWERESLTLGK